MSNIKFSYIDGKAEAQVTEGGQVISVPFHWTEWDRISFLFYFESLTPKAIARETGFSEVAVRKVLSRLPKRY